MVRLGNFLFHYRNALFPAAFLLLFWQGRPVFASSLTAAFAPAGEVFAASFGLSWGIQDQYRTTTTDSAYSGLVAPIGSGVFHVSPALVGLLAAAEPLGALLGGALIAAGVVRMDRRLTFAGGAGLFMVALIVMALSPSYWLAFAVLVIGGFGTFVGPVIGAARQRRAHAQAQAPNSESRTTELSVSALERRTKLMHWWLRTPKAERNAAEAQLRLWNASFMNADLGLAISDVRSNTFLAVNPAFARDRGYTQEELAGQPVGFAARTVGFGQFVHRLVDHPADPMLLPLYG